MHMCLTNVSYTYNTPIQEAIAVGLETEMQRMGQPESYLVQTTNTLQRKRDEITAVLKEVGMEPIVPEGGYFILADTSSIGKTFDSDEEAYDFQFTKWMITEKVYTHANTQHKLRSKHPLPNLKLHCNVMNTLVYIILCV